MSEPWDNPSAYEGKDEHTDINAAALDITKLTRQLVDMENDPAKITLLIRIVAQAGYIMGATRGGR